ncbi:MAG: hypothetical protein U0361_02065 [Nitrospiraceae bacterium]
MNMTFGFSRDDAAKFVDYYKTVNILETDPFAVLDREEGVGSLMQTAIAASRKTRNDGQARHLRRTRRAIPFQVEFCHQLGLDYMSCSPIVWPSPGRRSASRHCEEEDMKKARPGEEDCESQEGRETEESREGGKPAARTKSRTKRTKR